MGAPIKLNAEFFPHDNNMRSDRKIRALRVKFGLQGYAIYCMILESLCEADHLFLEWNEEEQEIFSGDFNVVTAELTPVIEYLIARNLIKCEGGIIYCPQLDRRINKFVFARRTNDLWASRRENEGFRAETGVSAAFYHENPHNCKENPGSLLEASKQVNKVNKAKQSKGTPIKNAEGSPEPVFAFSEFFALALEDQLKRSNLAPATVASFLEKYPRDYLEEKVRYYHFWLQSNTEKDKGAYLATMIRNGYSAPKGFSWDWFAESPPTPNDLDQKKAAAAKAKKEASDAQAQKAQEDLQWSGFSDEQKAEIDAEMLKRLKAANGFVWGIYQDEVIANGRNPDEVQLLGPVCKQIRSEIIGEMGE